MTGTARSAKRSAPATEPPGPGPPAVGTVEVCKERCMNYDHVLFFSSIAEVDNIMDMDETLKTKSEHEKITREIEQHLKDKTLLTFALSSDSCQLCDKCTYPRGGCRPS